MPIQRLELAGYNPRRITREAYGGLTASIDRFGCVQPVVWNQRSGRVVGGHQRLRVLRDRGDQEAEVVVVDLADVDEKALNVALNSPAIGGEFTGDLEGLLDEIRSAVPDLYESLLLDQLASGTEPTRALVEDQPCEPPARPAAGLGDLWLMGRHRVACGDSTDPAVIDALGVGRGSVRAVFTDPPYNVAYEGKKKKRDPIKNDALSREDFRALLCGAFGSAARLARAGSPIYICCSDLWVDEFRAAMTGCGWRYHQTIVWVKNHFVLGRLDYQAMHEPILYGWLAGERHAWYGGRRQKSVLGDSLPFGVVDDGSGGVTLSFCSGGVPVSVRVPSFEVLSVGSETGSTVWRFSRPVKSADHPTMKPVGLVARALGNSTRPGDSVFDPFLGSASTLSAAEQSGRCCVGVELDPRYVDVACRRYLDLTGESPVRASDGARFVDLKPDGQTPG